MDYIANDYWEPYESIIPKEKHIQSKKETFTVEGYNSWNCYLTMYLLFCSQKKVMNCPKLAV